MSHVKPRVFVSAVGSDLRSARHVVNDTLTQIQCIPVEETVFGTDFGRIREILATKIESCHAVIHLVGRDYGGEPDLATLPANHPRRSWAQIECDLAKEQKRKLFLVVFDYAFPFDPLNSPEPADKVFLQRKYRKAVLADTQHCSTVRTAAELKQQVELMKGDLELIRAKLYRQRNLYRMITATFVFLVALALYGTIHIIM